MRRADEPEVSEDLLVAAPPERLWPLVSDIALVVGTSDELQAVRWTDPGAPGPACGRTFVGVNRNRHFGEWETVSTITACDPPREFAWTVGDLAEPNTRWRFTLTPVDGGTLVTQWVKLGPGFNGLRVAIERMPDKEERIVEVRLAEWREAMRRNLALVKARAEGG